jgi:RNA polymerase sigma-70 factor (ECF subfamily)
VQLYGPLVFRWARSFQLQEADAADVVQNVFRTVLDKLEDIREREDGGKFRAWLWTVTRNKALDLIRATAAQAQTTGGGVSLDDFEQLPQRLEGEEADAARAELAQRVLQLARADFGATTMEAFWRLTVEGHSSADIARDLQISVSAVRQAKYRVLCRLREELSE